MFCAISKEQISDFRARVYGMLFQMAEDKQPIKDTKDFMQSIKTLLIEASKDEKGNPDEVWANTHIAFIPSTLLRGYGNSKLRSVLPKDTTELDELDKTFSNPDTGYKAIVTFLGDKQVKTAAEINSMVKADALQPKEKPLDMIESLEQLKKLLSWFETAAPSTPLSSTGQESTRDASGKYTNIIDPEQEFYMNVRSTILKAFKRTISSDLTAQELTIGNHTGFKLAAVSKRSLPGVKDEDYSQLRPSEAEIGRAHV